MKAVRSPSQARKPLQASTTGKANGIAASPSPVAWQKKVKRCKICREDIPPKEPGSRGRGRHRYCSNTCAEIGQHRLQELHKARNSTAPLEKKPCAICRKPFLPSKSTDCYCSDPCRKEGHHRVMMKCKRQRRAERRKREKEAR